MRSSFASVVAPGSPGALAVSRGLAVGFVLAVSSFGCGPLPAGYTDVCDGDVPHVAAGVSGAPAYDSVEIFQNGEVVDSTGTPCATATDGDCRAAYERAKKETGRRFVATRKNEVVVRENVTYAELGGTIDSEQEAAMLVFGRTFAQMCAGDDSVGAKAKENGFEVVVVSEGGARCATRSETRIRVERDGSVGVPVTVREEGYACPQREVRNTFEE
jgi:hypothetical protein